jgi:hypothetical protein
MDEITPAQVWTGFWKWLSVGLLGLALLGGLIYAGSQFGWWLQGQGIAHQSNNIRNNYATQESYVSQLSGYVSSIEGIAVQEAGTSGQQLVNLQAQALGIGNQACGVAAQISISLGADSSWVRANCSAGAVSVASPLRKGNQ